MANDSRSVEILDTTLRDGSYTIGYQFAADETALIAKGLERAGVSRIEIGHGLGLGADRAGKGRQREPDIAYISACAESLKVSRFGCFFIPGIGGAVDLRQLADGGAGFVRVGISLDGVEDSFEFIALAKQLKLEVWANVMKTYAFSLHECIERIARLSDAGIDGVYVVDSAGGMLPDQVREYVSAFREGVAQSGRRDVRIGFHGHDNLSLGTACSLAAVQAGCDIVDGSMLGLGRSLGNAATEVLAMVLKRAGFQVAVDPWRIADFADTMIRPFLENRWKYSTLEQALGYAQIHSGFLPILHSVARRKKIDVRALVLALGEDAKRNVRECDAALVADRIVSEMAPNGSRTCPSSENRNNGASIEPEDHGAESEAVSYTGQIRSQAARIGRISALVVTGPWMAGSERGNRYQQVRTLPRAVVGAIESSSPMEFENAAIRADGLVDIILLDTTPRAGDWRAVADRLRHRDWGSEVLPYADAVAGMVGACQIIALEAHRRHVREVAVLGDGARARLLKTLMEQSGVEIVKCDAAAIVIVASENSELGKLKPRPGMLVYDLMFGAIEPRIAQSLLDGGVDLVRLDGNAALAGAVNASLEAKRLVEQVMGRGTIDGTPVVAGGVWGKQGDVVLDSISRPKYVVGIADGAGNIKDHPNEREKKKMFALERRFREEIIFAIFGE